MRIGVPQDNPYLPVPRMAASGYGLFRRTACNQVPTSSTPILSSMEDNIGVLDVGTWLQAVLRKSPYPDAAILGTGKYGLS